MAAFRDFWRLPDGNWAVVHSLDRADLAGLGHALPGWLASAGRPADVGLDEPGDLEDVTPAFDDGEFFS